MKILPIEVVAEGEGCSLEAKVTGHPCPRVTWFKDGVPVSSNTDYITHTHNGVSRLTIEETMQVRVTAEFHRKGNSAIFHIFEWQNSGNVTF